MGGKIVTFLANAFLCMAVGNILNHFVGTNFLWMIGIGVGVILAIIIMNKKG